MTKQDFIKELEGLLLDIPLEERMEAIAYYETYFEDAGWENEDEILKELESPAKVAAGIKVLLNASEQDVSSRGYFTEKGYEDEELKNSKLELILGNDQNRKKNDKEEKTEHQTFSEEDKNKQNFNTNSSQEKDSYNRYNYQGKDNKTSKGILIVLLCIFAIPVGIPLIATAFSLMFAAVITLGALWLTFAILSVTLIFAGIAVTIVGVIKMVGIPAVGFFMTGSGIFIIGVGILFSLVTIGFTTKVFPVLFQGIVNLCKLPFRGRRVSA